MASNNPIEAPGEEKIELSLSVLRALNAPGFGESNMELLEKAGQDLVDAAVLLVKLKQEVAHDERRVATLAEDLIARAKTRVDICLNDLDCEREGLS